MMSREGSAGDVIGATAVPKRIALVIGSMETGGAQRVALNLAEDFAARGIAVDLIPLVAQGPLLADVPLNVSLVQLGRRGRSSIFALRRYIQKTQPTAIIAFTFHANLIAALAHIGLGRRSSQILSVHSTFSAALREHSPAVRAILYIGTLLLYPFADHLVAVSEGAADDLARVARIDRARIVTIHNPVLDRNFEVAALDPIDHPWVASGIPLLVSVGRLSEAKDYPTLIRAFVRVRERLDARLLILGEGDRRAEIEELVRNSGVGGDIGLLGHIRNPIPWMKAADVFVMTSKREGFGNVLVEAMATGIPIVSTDCPHGPSEILEKGKWGKLVPVGNDQAIAGAILDSLWSEAVDGRVRAWNFTVEEAADGYLALVSPTSTDCNSGHLLHRVANSICNRTR
jgi:glycosyltransferase involved in cell wall biosynthesis